MALSHLAAASRYDFDCAVLAFGEIFEAKQRETVEQPLPKGKREPTMPVPKYSEADLRRFLGLPAGDGDPAVLADEPTPAELAMIDDILRGRADWLKGSD